jgi:hypothetical protein
VLVDLYAPVKVEGSKKLLVFGGVVKEATADEEVAVDRVEHAYSYDRARQTLAVLFGVPHSN